MSFLKIFEKIDHVITAPHCAFYLFNGLAVYSIFYLTILISCNFAKSSHSVTQVSPLMCWFHRIIALITGVMLTDIAHNFSHFTKGKTFMVPYITIAISSYESSLFEHDKILHMSQQQWCLAVSQQHCCQDVCSKLASPCCICFIVRFYQNRFASFLSCTSTILIKLTTGHIW